MKHHAGQAPPVKEGEKYNLEVEAYGKNGDPIMKLEKYVLFVKSPSRKLSVGEKAWVQVTKVLPQFGFAELIEAP